MNGTVPRVLGGISREELTPPTVEKQNQGWGSGLRPLLPYGIETPESNDGPFKLRNIV